jgi:hypothetical protein
LATQFILTPLSKINAPPSRWCLHVAGGNAYMMTLLQGVRRDQPVEPSLLNERMNALGLDVGAWQRFQPTMTTELRDACSVCRERVRCQLDLATHSEDANWPGWKDYCPNAAKLDLLVALQFY